MARTLPDEWLEAWRTRSAVEFREWLREADLTAPHAELLDYRMEKSDTGLTVLSWEVPEVLLNPAGIAHGGFLAAILDDAAGMAVASAFPRWVPQLTVHLEVDYLAPVLPGIVHRVEGEVVRHGRSSSLGDARILDPDGRLCARGSGVFQPNRRMVPRELWSEAGL